MDQLVNEIHENWFSTDNDGNSMDTTVDVFFKELHFKQEFVICVFIVTVFTVYEQF